MENINTLVEVRNSEVNIETHRVLGSDVVLKFKRVFISFPMQTN